MEKITDPARQGEILDLKQNPKGKRKLFIESYG